MVRLLAVRVFIAIWRRAIAVSDRLTPRTWIYVLICHLALLALSVWGLNVVRDRNGVDPNRIELLNCIPCTLMSDAPDKGAPTDLLIFRDMTGSAGHVAVVTNNTGLYILATPHYGRPVVVLNGAFTAYEHLDAAPHVSFGLKPFWWVAYDELPPLSLSANAAPASTVKPLFFWRRALRSRALAEAITSTEDFRFVSREWYDPRRFTDYTPNVVVNLSAPESNSLVKTLQTWALIFNTLVGALGSVFSSTFLWISYHRGKADHLLKLAQLEQVRLENERLRLEIERMRREEQKSLVILASS
jgi:hypothetical protein